MKQTFKTIVMLATGVLLSSGAAAQINFTQPKVAEPKAPDPLERYSEARKQAILAPYDSIELTIPADLPSAPEFYKKYVGQRLFLYGQSPLKKLFSSKYTRVGDILQKIKTYLYAPVKINFNYVPHYSNGTYGSYYTNGTSALNKYYDIVDVGNLWDFKDEDFISSVYGNGSESYIIKEDEKTEPLPMLVVKAVESGETFYIPLKRTNGFEKAKPSTSVSEHELADRMVLVGAMVKLQQTLVGETLLIKNYGDWDKADKWKCINVSIVEQNFFKVEYEYSYDRTPSLILQCISEGEQKGEERALPISIYYSNRSISYSNSSRDYKSWRLEKEYEKEQAEKAEKKRIADEQAARERAAKEAQEKEAREAREQAEQEAQEARKKQRIADSIKTQRAQEEEERQKAAEKAQRKQQLIAKYGTHWGQKVFEGRPVVGMTIAMCNDTGIAKFRTFHAEVGAKEVWVVNLIFATQTLTFVNGKLTEIETMKTSIF